MDQIFSCGDCSHNIEIPLLDCIPEDPRPHLELKIFETRVIGLMDSGASCSILGDGGDKLLSALKLIPRKYSRIVQVADGKCLVCTGIVDIPFTYSNITHIIPTLIVPKIKTLLTLGIDFWTKFKFSPAIINSIENEEVTTFVDLNEEQKIKLQEIVGSFLITTDDFFGCTGVLQHKIDTGDANPVRRNARPVPYHLLKAVDVEIDRLLGREIIRECPESPWLNPVQIAPKKSGAVRMCIDGRWLNQVTVRDSYPIPHIEGIINRLEDFSFVSSIDLSDAFLQIPLEEHSQIKTAFAIPGRKMYCYRRMPFGLMNSPMTMARLMNIVMGNDLEPNVFCFLDDIIIVTKDFNSHIKMLKEVSDRLRKANLSINVEKSKFCAEKLEYLGYTLSPKGIGTNEFKVAAILNLPVPKTVKQLRQILGMVGWFRRFIPNFSVVAKPLTDLLKGDVVKITWNEKADEAFSKLKELLTSAPILMLPDYSQPFIVRSDASDVGAGGMLLQGEGENQRVICYVSKKFTAAEQKYSTTEKEAYGALICLRRFAPFLLYRKFRLETDHSALLWILKQKDAKGRIGRWILEFQQFEFDMIHRPGRELVVSDTLSRNISSVQMKEDKWFDEICNGMFEDPSKYPEFKFENDSLFKYCQEKTPFKTVTFRWKQCVHKSEVKILISKYHDSTNAAHFGFYKTYRKIYDKFFWPTMRTDIKNYVKKCEVCKKTKSPNTSLTPPMGSHIVASRPWEHISVDFIGPLVRSSEGYRHILVVVDKLTKFVLVFPVRDASSSILIKTFSQNIFPIFGVPRVLLSDNGPAFVASTFAEFLKELGIEQWHTAAYSPQSNPVERSNRTIITAIRAYIGDKHNNWPKYLPEIGIAMRSSIHDTTQCTPYYLNFGQEMIVNGEEYKIQDANKSKNFDERMQDLRKSRESAKVRLKDSHEISKRRYDLRTRPVKFAVGDIVYRRSFALSDASKGKQAKFCPWIKSRIISIKGQLYELEDVENKRKGKFHAKDIKPG